MKLGFQISSTSSVHFSGFGLSTYQHPRSNEVEEFVPKLLPSQYQMPNQKLNKNYVQKFLTTNFNQKQNPKYIPKSKLG